MNTFTTIVTGTFAALASTAIVFAHPDYTYPAVADDSPQWDCQTMGDQICGPGSGVTAGQYRNGVLIPWPHEYVPTWCKDICLGA